MQADEVGHQDIGARLTRVVPDNLMKISELALVFLFAAEENQRWRPGRLTLRCIHWQN